MDEEIIDEKLLSSLNKICCDLISMLHKTETILLVEKQKYERVTEVCKPWPVKKTKSSEHNLQCTCSDISNLTNESKDDNNETFVDNIPSIVSQAKALRQNPYSSNCSSMTKFSKARKSIRETISCTRTDISVPKVDKSKSHMTLNKSCTSFKPSTLKPSKSSHGPSCSLYGSFTTDLSKTTSVSNLSDAISMYGVPDKLNRALKDYHKFVLRSDQQDIVLTKSLNAFLKYLNRQTNETWKTVEENVEKMPKYMLALNSIEKNSSSNESRVPCIIYRNIEDLIILEKSKTDLHEKEMWHDILRYLNRDFTIILMQCDLTKHQKIYLYKLLQAMCNFSQTRIPKIPIFRINS